MPCDAPLVYEGIGDSMSDCSSNAFKVPEPTDRTCDMCGNFTPPIKSGYPLGLCGYVMDEVARKSGFAEQCGGFEPKIICDA